MALLWWPRSSMADVLVAGPRSDSSQTLGESRSSLGGPAGSQMACAPGWQILGPQALAVPQPALNEVCGKRVTLGQEGAQ